MNHLVSFILVFFWTNRRIPIYDSCRLRALCCTIGGVKFAVTSLLITSLMSNVSAPCNVPAPPTHPRTPATPLTRSITHPSPPSHPVRRPEHLLRPKVEGHAKRGTLGRPPPGIHASTHTMCKVEGIGNHRTQNPG